MKTESYKLSIEDRMLLKLTVPSLRRSLLLGVFSDFVFISKSPLGSNMHLTASNLFFNKKTSRKNRDEAEAEESKAAVTDRSRS